MKTIINSVILLLSVIQMNAQVQLLNVNFDAGVPMAWMQQPAGTWTLGTAFDNPGNCMISEAINSNTATVSMNSPTLNLTAVNNLTVSFKVAVTKNNFLAPEFTLGYNAGSGTQTLATWGEWFSGTATYTILGSEDYQYPLDGEHVTWQICTHTIAAINSPSCSFVFRGDIINGGWVLLDSIVVKGIPTNTAVTGIHQNAVQGDIQLVPNPASEKMRITGENISSLHVYDAVGREIYPPIINNINISEVDLSELAKGIYFIEVKTSTGNLLRKKIIHD